MELVIFFAVLSLVGILLYFLLCFFFFAFTARPVFLALNLSWKMSVGSIIGLPLLGFGAVLLPAIWFNAAVEHLPNYSKWRDISAAFLISIASCVVMYFTAFWLAWEVFG